MINFDAMIFDDHFILIQPKLAMLVGLNESVILQQLHYWLKDKASIWAEGKPWVYNSIREWQLQFPFWSEDTIRRTLKGMEKAGYVLTGNHSTNKFDRRIHYTIDYSNLHKSIYAKCPNGSMQDAQILTETTSENTNIDYQPTNQSVVDTQKQTINGKPMLDSYSSEQGPAVPVYYGADGKVYRCRGGEEPIGTARIADKPSAGSGAVVGGLDSSMSGGEDAFYDGGPFDEDEDTSDRHTLEENERVLDESDFSDSYNVGYRDGVAGEPRCYGDFTGNPSGKQDYLEGYAAGEKRAKARQAAPAREVKDVCVAPPMGKVSSEPLSPQVEASRPPSAVVSTGSVVANTAPVENWSEKTREYAVELEAASNEWLWKQCLQFLKSEDMMYLQREKAKAQRNPLGYIRNAMIRTLMLDFELKVNPKAVNQPCTKSWNPTTTPRPTDGPASHRLLVNDDPERERKLAEMEALAGLGPVPEHMKIRRKKKEVQ